MGRLGNLLSAAALALSAIVMPSGALAASGGASVPGSSSTASAPGVGAPTAPGVGAPTAPAGAQTGVPTTVSGNGITMTAASATLEHGGLRIMGTVPASDAGQTLVIQRLAASPGSTWTTATQTTVASGGSFVAVWHSGHTGQFALQASVPGSGATSPSISVTVYRPSTATLYGPGLFGHHTACGAVLRRATVGVANRNLPCGTSVSIYYRGKIAVVPVIDRGPFANEANWDLTEATAQSLGMSGTSTIGTIPVSSS